MQKDTKNSSVENDFEDINNTESTVDINTDESVAGTHHLSQNLQEDDPVDKLKAELYEQKDKYLRLLAEFENYKRRSSRERIELSQTAGKEIIVSLLDVLDDCDRAETQLQQEKSSQDLSGVFLVFNKLRNILQNRGLKPMESMN
jgi:molecular chaperone GrpE